MRSLVLGISLALSLSTVALAGDNKAESDKLFGEGLQLFTQKDYNHARMKFAEAYSKYPSPNSLLNLARAEQLMGECVDAVLHYRAYIALPENPRISSFDRGSATIKLNECLAKIGRVQVTAPRGAVTCTRPIFARHSLSLMVAEPRSKLEMRGFSGSAMYAR